MTDPVCAHGQTAAQGCVWCPKKPGGTEYETGYDRAPINREQIMLGDITDLRERVSDLERQLANCGTPQEPPGESQDNCDTIAPTVWGDWLEDEDYGPTVAIVGRIVNTSGLDQEGAIEVIGEQWMEFQGNGDASVSTQGEEVVLEVSVPYGTDARRAPVRDAIVAALERHAPVTPSEPTKKFELIPISELEVGDTFLTKDYDVAELTYIYEHRGSYYEIGYKDENGKVWSGSFAYGAQVMTSSEPVQATALGDSPTQSDRFGCASGSEPFDLVTAIATVLKSRDTDWDYEVDEYMDDADAVLSVLRSTAFRQWAASKEDHSECDYYCSRGDCFVSLSSLLTELFGEVGRVTSLYFFTCQVCHEPYQIKDGITIEVDGGYGTKSPCCGDVAPHWYSYGGEWTPPAPLPIEDDQIVMKVVKFSEWIKDPDAYLEETE